MLLILLSPFAYTFIVKTSEKWNYQSLVSKILSKIRLDKPVELIHPDNLAMYRWRFGSGDLKFTKDSNDVNQLTITSFEPSLIELLPETGVDNYEIAVEIKQNNYYNSHAACGVFVCLQQFNTSEGEQNGFIKAQFSDIGPNAVAHMVKNKATSKYFLDANILGKSQNSPYRLFSRLFQKNSIAYEAPAPMTTPGPSRIINLKVNTSTVSTSCPWLSDKIIEQKIPIRVQSILNDEELKKHQDLNRANIVTSQNGGVGLYVYGCTIVLKKFTLNPLHSQQ